MPGSAKVALVGQTMGPGRESVVATAAVGQRVWLIPQPDNAHDPNAVAVVLGRQQAGYLPAAVAARMRLDEPTAGVIADVRVHNGVVRGFDIAIPKGLVGPRAIQPA